MQSPWGTAPKQIVLAVGQALARGWLAGEELRQAAAGCPHRVALLMEAALAEAGIAGVGA